MKKYITLNVLIAAFVFGFSSPTFAQNCTVQKGDSFWKIAKIYNVDFHELLKLNKHFENPHLIFPDEKIELPDGSAGTETTTASNDDSIETGKQSAPVNGVSDMAEAVLILVNNERAKQGLNKLSLSDDITDIAQLKADDMNENGYFDHTSPTYGTPFEMLQSHGISYKTAGENIAKGQLTANDVMNAWMNSSGHRANILSSAYTEIGIGYSVDASGSPAWVQMFIGK